MSRKIMKTYFFISVVLISQFGYAYLDPGSGSIFFQGLLVAIIGGFYFLKGKLTLLFQKNKNKASIQSTEPTTQGNPENAN